MKIVITVMVVMFMTGMAAWLILYRRFAALIYDVRNGEYKTPLMKQIVIKYSNCTKLEITIHNVNAFVEKIIENYKEYGLRFAEWEKVAKAMEYLIVMLSVAAAFAMRTSLDELYICATVGLLSALALHLCGRLTDTRGVRRTLLAETVDYLENSGELLDYSLAVKPEVKKLTGRAAAEFMKMSRRYERIQAASTGKCDAAKNEAV